MRRERTEASMQHCKLGIIVGPTNFIYTIILRNISVALEYERIVMS